MPSALASSLLIFGAVLTSVSDVAGVCVAGAGVLIEVGRFYIIGVSGAPAVPPRVE